MTLIDRLSKLEGPDREVDAEIVFDLFATPVGKHKEDGGPIGYIDLADQPSWNLGMRFPGKDKAWFAATRKQIKGETLLIERDNAYVLMNSIRVPDLTASVDAAIALAERVLPGWVFDNVGQDFHSLPSGYEAFGWNVELINGTRVQGQAPTFPLAICIAILRAKEASTL
ncbi:hypothetical protein [Ochrobactrum sp. Marseille-Q0166]|uniref:hypothetical protein n=1 Tax=Ochrobactrum sp. Marseille-Q0166 TaxID=2761105 RepID=UPI001656230C|nr:hypothetical protein [Ochrobactrum sp. Marseille-Q0166]MBC8718774.1 hypothetical protein [Ochrobactrum sp. Marseille-Q0166]